MEKEVSFAEENTPPRFSNMPSSSSGMLGWLVVHKIARNTTEAQQILLGAVIVFFVVAGAILFFSNHPAHPALTPVSSYWPRPL